MSLTIVSKDEFKELLQNIYFMRTSWLTGIKLGRVYLCLNPPTTKEMLKEAQDESDKLS